MPKEQYIYANNNGYQYQNVSHHIDIPWHFNHPFEYWLERLPPRQSTLLTDDLPDCRQP
jgi:hypothetical protein